VFCGVVKIVHSRVLPPSERVERSLSPLLLLFQQTQSIAQDFARTDVTPFVDLRPYEPLEVFTKGTA
jgi:hypothetical protein